MYLVENPVLQRELLVNLRMGRAFFLLLFYLGMLGVVVLLDRRVVTKRYGSAMLEGLPPATKAIGNWPDVRREVEEFFALHSIGAPISSG